MQLPAKYTPAFSRDLKKKATKHQWNLQELEAVIDLIIENTRESLNILKHRHNMHKLLGEWDGSNECHIANAGDWLVIWKTVDGIAYFQHTGSHDDPVCKKTEKRNQTRHRLRKSKAVEVHHKVYLT